jgi:hypothetical protein
MYWISFTDKLGSSQGKAPQLSAHLVIVKKTCFLQGMELGRWNDGEKLWRVPPLSGGLIAQILFLGLILIGGHVLTPLRMGGLRFHRDPDSVLTFNRQRIRMSCNSTSTLKCKCHVRLKGGKEKEKGNQGLHRYHVYIGTTLRPAGMS